MTLIAFATYGDHAELITDTAAYTSRGRDFAHSTKQMTINHLDAIMATQGDSVFAIIAKCEVLAASCTAPTFDDLIDLTPEALRYAWANLESKHSESLDGALDRVEASVYLIGHSPKAGRFVAYRFLREHDFALETIGDSLHVTPSPLTMRPQRFEVDRAASSVGIPDDFRDQWFAQPKPSVPTDLAEWGMLALRVRYERAVPSHPLKTFVGGKVIHTHIGRDLVQTMTLTEYDDDGAEFARMVAGTRHPLAQHGPCHCGSGKTLLECCDLPHLDDPCGCGKTGSGDKSFRDCCMVPFG